MGEDIEVEIMSNINTQQYISHKYERYFRNVKMDCHVGFRHFFNDDELFVNLLNSDKHNMDIEFYDNGKLKSIAKILDKTNYHHYYYKTGATSETYYSVKRNKFYKEKKYTKSGRTNYKVVYGDDGEKDHAVVYWHGPRLPEEDGRMVRCNRMGTV